MNYSLNLFIACSMFFLSITTAQGQQEFIALEKDRHINSVIVNKKMFDMMSNVGVAPANDQEKAYYELIKKLNSLEVYHTSNTQARQKIEKQVNDYITKAQLKQYSANNKQDELVTIYIDKNATPKKVEQLLMLNQGSGNKEHILLLVKGNFALEELSSITDKMSLPIGNSLKQ